METDMTELDQRKLSIITLFTDFPNGITFQTFKTKKESDKYKHLSLPKDQQILASLIYMLVEEGKLVTWVVSKQKYIGISEPAKLKQQKIVNKKETINKEDVKKVEVVKEKQSNYSVELDKPKLIQFLSDFISSPLFSFDCKQDLQEIKADLLTQNKEEKLRLLEELISNKFLSEEIKQNLTAIHGFLTSRD